MKTLRALALKYPDCEEGIACKGTALECITFNVKGKAFLFVGRKEIRFKLGDSVDEAKKLAAKEPTRYTVGANGWTKITFNDDEPLPTDVLARWVDESYRLMAGTGATTAPKPKKKNAPTKGRTKK